LLTCPSASRSLGRVRNLWINTGPDPLVGDQRLPLRDDNNNDENALRAIVMYSLFMSVDVGDDDFMREAHINGRIRLSSSFVNEYFFSMDGSKKTHTPRANPNR
jgi:hypothetical protein